MDNVAGNLNTAIPQPPDPQRVVRVFHVEQNPVGFLFARGQAVAIGTGPVAGYVWKKTTTTSSSKDWVVDIQPTAGSNVGGSSTEADFPPGGGFSSPSDTPPEGIGVAT